MGVILATSGLVAVAALFWSAYGTYYVLRREAGDERMRQIQGFIREGAWAFMIAEAKVMAVTLLIIGAILWAIFYWEVAVSFWVGSGLSMAAGFIGMNAATLANARTTHAVRRSLREALTVAFTGGSVMGLGVAGLSAAGLGVRDLAFPPGIRSSYGAHHHQNDLRHSRCGCELHQGSSHRFRLLRRCLVGGPL